MDNLSVSIVIGGRFHAFDLARQLYARGALRHLVTNYPKLKTRDWQLPDTRVVSLPESLVLQKVIARFGETAFQRSVPLLQRTFAARASRHLEGSNVVHAWSGVARPAFRWAARNGALRVVERGSAHILTQTEILDEEHKKLGLTWARTHQAVIDAELEEYATADLIAVPSLFVKASFLERGIPEARLLHSPFGANVASFEPGTKRDDVFRIAYAGQLSVRKGVHYLVDAFNLAEITDSELCLIGSPSAHTTLLLRAAGTNVRLVGHVTQSKLAQQYQQASVFAMASIEEGLALVQAQAMACGLPLVCTSNTGGEDLLQRSGPLVAMHEDGIKEYPAGYVVPIRRPDLMARCFRWLADDRHLLRDKQAATVAFRRTGLDWASYGDRIIAGYERALRSRGTADGRHQSA